MFYEASYIEECHISEAQSFFNRNETLTDSRVLERLWRFMMKAGSHQWEFSNFDSMKAAALNYSGFTDKQRKRIREGKLGPQPQPDGEWYPCYDGPDDIDRYLGHGEWDTGPDEGYWA
eukprot:Filipodium_phascolosomae@DN307_c0_g1_i1.p1